MGRSDPSGVDGYIRRTIKLCSDMQVRKVRGPVLDMFYARLKKCGDLACNGRPFTEHRNVPMLKRTQLTACQSSARSRTRV